MPAIDRPPAPWDGFFHELDSAVNTIVRLDCIGGFVFTQLYGLERPTADVDVVELAPSGPAASIMERGANQAEAWRRDLKSGRPRLPQKHE